MLSAVKGTYLIQGGPCDGRKGYHMPNRCFDQPRRPKKCPCDGSEDSRHMSMAARTTPACWAAVGLVAKKSMLGGKVSAGAISGGAATGGRSDLHNTRRNSFQLYILLSIHACSVRASQPSFASEAGLQQQHSIFVGMPWTEECVNWRQIVLTYMLVGPGEGAVDCGLSKSVAPIRRSCLP